MIYNTIINKLPLELELHSLLNKIYITNKDASTFDCKKISENSYSILIDNKVYNVSTFINQNEYKIIINHKVYKVNVKDEADLFLQNTGININSDTNEGKIYAEIPGLISQIFVKKGDNVKLNQKLCILEAMKMENEITSPINGKIININCSKGSSIDKGKLIMEII